MRTPWPVCIVDESGRRRLAALLLFLNIGEVIVGCLLAYRSVRPELQAVLNFSRDARSFPWLVRGAAALFICLHGPGIFMAVDCLCPNKRTRWVSGMHCWWLFFLSTYGVASMCLLLANALCRDLRSLVTTFLPNAMEHYGRNPHLRYALDTLQATLQCCGDRHYGDWSNTAWQETSVENVNGRRVSLHEDLSGTDYRNGLEDMVPFSCCARRFLGPCIRHRAGWKIGRMRRSIYREGCRVIVLQTLTENLVIVFVIQIISLLLQVGILITARFLQTSIGSSIYQEDPKAPSPCWLLNDNFFHFQRRDFPTEDEVLIQEWLKVNAKPRPLKNIFCNLFKRKDRVAKKPCAPTRKQKPKKPCDSQIDPDEVQRRKVRATLVKRVIKGQSQTTIIRELPYVSSKKKKCKKETDVKRKCPK